MTDYTILASQTLFDSPGIRILKDTVEHNGQRRAWFCLQGPADAIACLAFAEGGQVVLTRQYRHGVRDVIVDLPGGIVHPGETLAQAAARPDPHGRARACGDYGGPAARELQEETGYRAGQMELLCRYVAFPGLMGVRMNIFLAAGLTPGVQSLDEGEELEVVLMPAAGVLQMILRGELIDSSVQLGLLLAAQKGLIPG